MAIKGIPMCGELVRALKNTKVDVWPAAASDPSKSFKWQTRRCVTEKQLNRYRAILPVPMPLDRLGNTWRAYVLAPEERVNGQYMKRALLRIPPYQVGDLLYVREGLRRSRRPSMAIPRNQIWYAEYGADGEAVLAKDSHGSLQLLPWRWTKANGYKTDRESLPSLFMPRDAARIWLRVMGVGCERAQDISEADAQAEGATQMHLVDLGQTWKSYRRGFQSLWDGLNAKRGYAWADNPWVWAYELARVSPPISTTAENAEGAEETNDGE